MNKHALVLVWLAFFLIAATVLAACQSAPTPTPAPTATATLPPPSPTATPRSVEQINAGIKNSPFPDRVHLDKGVTCQNCHTPFPPQSVPAMETCLGCHGGAYMALAARTAKMDPNPHASHLGNEPCTTCHGIHKPFHLYCTECHPDRKYTGRFAVATPTP